MRDKSEAALIERQDRADKREDAVHAKLSISSWEMTACAKVREFIVSSGRYAHQVNIMAEDADGILCHYNGTPVRIRVEALTGAEREALHFGSRNPDRGHDAPDAAGRISSPTASSAAIVSTVAA